MIWTVEIFIIKKLFFIIDLLSINFYSINIIEQNFITCITYNYYKILIDRIIGRPHTKYILILLALIQYFHIFNNHLIIIRGLN